MDVIGIRKLIAYAMGVIGVVLVTWFKVPQEQVDTLNKLVLDLIPMLASIIAVVGSMMAYFKSNLKEKEIAASTPVAPAEPAKPATGNVQSGV